VVIDGSEGATVQLASCCCPVPGDPIAGYLGRGEGLVVHTQHCGAGRRLFERDSERWIDVVWSDEPTRQFESVVSVLVTNGKGVLAQVAASISSAETDITHIEMGDERLGETAELRLTVSVRDTEHLADVLRTLRRCTVVLKAERVCP
jgi:guanosine-3',5'-bis(diphosphate) 3'-pyrophosphohydrolase